MPQAAELASQKQIPTITYSNSNSIGLENFIYVTTYTLYLGNSAIFSPSYTVYVWGKTLEVPKLPT